MISIIITAYKEEKTIGRSIESFKKQKIKDKHEIIVVAPDKPTLTEAKKHKVKTLKDPKKGKPVALNLAFKKAKGNILILTDGDVYSSENVVKELIKPFKDPKIGAVAARPISLNNRKTMLGYWSHLLTDIGAHKTRLRRSKQGKFILCSGYLYAMRNIIDKIPEDALSDDAVISHMIWKKGYKIAYAPKALVYVKYPTNFKDWFIQKRRSTGGYNQIPQYIKNPQRMRSFFRELIYSYQAWAYPRNLREFFYTLALYFVKLYLWIRIFIDLNIKKKTLKEVWKRVESTK